MCAGTNAPIPSDLHDYMYRTVQGAEAAEAAVASALYRTSLHTWRRLRLVVFDEDGPQAVTRVWQCTGHALYPDGASIVVVKVGGAYCLVHYSGCCFLDDNAWSASWVGTEDDAVEGVGPYARSFLAPPAEEVVVSTEAGSRSHAWTPPAALAETETFGALAPSLL